MKHSGFVHLHLHTQYSLLDGGCLIPKLIDRAVELNMPAISMTDHGNMFGTIEFYQEAMRRGIKPIIGCEVYVAPDSRFEKSAHGIKEAAYHLLLLVKDEEGYKNLMKLVSLGYLEGFYYKPRIDKELLQQYSKGLIGMSACLKGEIPHLILSDRMEEAGRLADFFRTTFGEGNFYIELQDHGIAEQKKVNNALIKLSKDMGIPVVATNDVHYINRDDAKAHDALLCIGTQTTLDEISRMRMQGDNFYLKSFEEMQATFSEIPEAIANTIEIAEKCNLELDFTKTHLPHYTPPDGKKRDQYLKELCDKGLKERYSAESDDKINERLNYEIEVINNAGLTSYFLIVWDFVHYAKENGIPMGPGRGSAAGCLVSYLLGITDIDPLKYDLLFERFLNPERARMPDIDIDFCYERRGEILDYVVKRYGKDKVAQIITFGTMAAKGVIRDVARVMAIPYGEADKIAKLIPNDLNIKLKDALEKEPELMALYKNDPKITQLIDISMRLEGLTRHASTHAAGVVISEKPLLEYVPLFKTNEDQITTGFPMSSLEKIGLLKVDILGLRNLTVIDEAIKIIRRTKGVDVDIDHIPLDDSKAFELLSKAETIGVFQLESSGMRDILRKMSIEKFEDIIAVLALFRPGPIGSGMVDDFIKRKHDNTLIKYDDKGLEPILKETYGVILYQEQVMRIVSSLAGFSLAQADLLRRAMSKKTPEIMEPLRISFVTGAIENGVSKNAADKIFNLIEFFAGYGFNKSHSAAYAMISYRTAYLKANYPVEFITALLTSERGNTDKVVIYIDEARKMGIEVLPPDVSESFANFTMVGNAIRFGLGAVKNVGQGAIDSIVGTRQQHGRFESLYDFCEHVDLRLVNRKVLESLIKCGAFDSFNLYRSQLTAMLDHALEVAAGFQKDRQNGQLSFFDTFEDHGKFKKTFENVPDIKEWPENQILAFEKSLLGFYITGHPLAKYAKSIKTYAATSSAGLSSFRDGDEVSLGGILGKVKQTVTKRKGEKMAILTLEDLDGIVEVLVFPNVYSQVARNIAEDAIVFVKGRVSLRDDQPKVIASYIIPIEDAPRRYTMAVNIELLDPGLDDVALSSIKDMLSRHSGDIPVYLNIKSPNNGKGNKILVDRSLFVQPSEDFISDAERLVGSGNLKLLV